MTDIFGTYNLRTRIGAGITLFAPVLFQAYILIPELRNISCTFIVALITFALINLIIVTSRVHGSASLKKCFPDVLPAQQYLLPEDTTLDKFTKERYYKFLENHLEGFKVTNNKNEMKLQTESAVKWLIAKTRNTTDFPLIAEENANLGFSYNLLGMKPCGIFLCSFLLVADIAVLFLACIDVLSVELISILFCAAFTILFLLVWIIFINKKLVQCNGKKYARALLSACDSISIK